MKKLKGKGLTAWLLIFVLLLTSVNLTTWAADSSSGALINPGKGNSTVTAYDSNCNAVMQKAWLVYIEEVENTHIDDEPETDHNKVTWSQCKKSAIDEMLLTYPKEYRPETMDELVDKCFIVTDGNYSFDYNNVRIYESQNSRSSTPCVTYRLKNYPNPGGLKINCVSDNILTEEYNIEAFKSGEWRLAEYEYCLLTEVDSRSVSLDEAKKNFLGQFQDLSKLSGMITDSFDGSKAMHPDKIDVIRNSITLDLLTVIAACSKDRHVYDEYIQNYLQYQNRDGSPKFYVPVIISGVIANKAGDPNPCFYSLPTYLDRAYVNMSADKLFYINDGFGNYAMDYNGFQDAVWSYLGMDNRKVVSDTKYFENQLGVWFLNGFKPAMDTFRGMAYTALPTDRNDWATGNLGYTFFAYGGEGNVASKDISTFKLTATSDQKTVTTPGSKVAATLHIDMKCSKADQQKFMDTFTAEKAKGHNTADLVIEYSLETVKGNGSSTPLIDKQLGVGSVLGGNKLEWSNITYDKLKPYLEGEKMIEVLDQNIPINETTTNKYKATVTLKFPGNELKVKATGKEVVSEYVAADKVTWSLGEDEPNKFHYYSVMGKPNAKDNYVEIKQGLPGNESWEAMAGVPTTENLYVGFGATEFMMNFDGEWKSQTGADRVYTWTYTAPKCIEEDEECVISKTTHTCPHTKPVSDGHGGTMDVDDTQSFECGETCPRCGGNGGCPGDTHNCTHKTGDVGVGCQVDQKINSAHPHAHTWTGKVTQPINQFSYLDITDINAWMLSQAKYSGNASMTNPSSFTLDPKLGYAAFTSQGEFKHGNNAQSNTDGNGRLVFFAKGADQKVNNENIYGNTAHVCGTNGDGITVVADKTLRADLGIEAWKAINDCIKQNQGIWCEVVSDYVAVQTSEGWQIPCSYTYPSEVVSIGDIVFETTDTDAQEASAQAITFSSIPRIQSMWQNNDTKNSAAKWDPQHLTRSGYNGHYNMPGSKWDNGTNITVNDSYANKNHGSGISPQGANKVMPNGWNKLAQAVGYDRHPNSILKEGSSSYATGFSNLRLTKTGLDINDVMSTEDRTWPQGSEPRVKNGEQETGHAYTKYSRILRQGSPGGEDYSSFETEQEVGYTNGKSKINNIVVHNPVSTQNAYIICNDSKYDLRSAASLADGGDPDSGLTGCPGDASCQYQTLKCTIHSPIYHTDACYTTVSSVSDHVGGLNVHGYHMSDCTHVHSVEAGCYDVCGSTAFHEEEREDGHYETCGGYSGGCAKHPTPQPHWKVDGHHTVYICDVCGSEYNERPVSCTNKTLKCTKSTAPNAECTGVPNTHVCTSECKTVTQKVLTCDNPHHIEHGQEDTWNYNSSSCHYTYGDSRCWQPCNDDSRHKKFTGQIVQTGDGTASTSDTFINIDREFKIYYPDTGDFAEAPSMHGILDTTDTRGMGYTDNMDCSRWTRDKFVVFPVSVVFKDQDGNFTKQAAAYQPINVRNIPCDGNYTWTFYAVLSNSEMKNAVAKFVSIASNAKTTLYYDESNGVTNRARTDWIHAARHTASKTQYVDVLGSIGGLAIEDTGDYRFATLFKQKKGNNKWLVENIVPEVNPRLPNKIVADNKDVRSETTTSGTKWHDTYGTQYMSTGGKAYKHVDLPLTPADNPIKSLREQPMRPGYNLFMDVSTIGNYYGENLDTNGQWSDKDLYYKMTIEPRYWLLNLDTKKYTPLDAYMGRNGEYTIAASFNGEKTAEHYLYLDWLNESARRNYTAGEREMSAKVTDIYSDHDTGGTKLRIPNKKDVLGTAQMLHLNDLNRTFIGSSKTYGVDRNPENYMIEEMYARQGQRWHWTIGLPSSVVFVEAGKPCTTANIDKISKQDAVIVCTLGIKVRGTVWTLEYDGKAINNIDGGGFKIFDTGDHEDVVYPPPKEPGSTEETKDPIVAVYDNKYTAADDMRTEGSH